MIKNTKKRASLYFIYVEGSHCFCHSTILTSKISVLLRERTVLNQILPQLHINHVFKSSCFLRITTVYSKQSQKMLPVIVSQEKNGRGMQIRYNYAWVLVKLQASPTILRLQDTYYNSPLKINYNLSVYSLRKMPLMFLKYIFTVLHFNFI